MISIEIIRCLFDIEQNFNIFESESYLELDCKKNFKIKILQI